ncbi:YVTN repeat-like/Quino protein amine dehydrogenase, partial [Clavulina sp. PMI_390]
MTIVFYQGAPYKYDKSIRTHTRFVQDVRFSPSGDVFGSAGADGAVFLYNGTTGDVVAELKDAHQGSAMAMSWSPDSKQFFTSSADRTVKLWDVETSKSITTWDTGSAIENQQVGNAWVGEDQLVSLSVGGELSVYDRRVGDRPSKILYGAQKAITSSAIGKDRTFYAGTYDGRVHGYTTSGDINLVNGQAHTGQVAALATAAGGGDTIYSAGYDDCVREISAPEASFTRTTLSTGSQPRDLAVVSSNVVVAALINSIAVYEGSAAKSTLSVSFSPLSIAATANGVVAVGGDDNKVHLYTYASGGLKEDGVLENNRGPVYAVAFSPDGSKLVAGDSLGKIFLYDVAQRSMITGRWTSHSARIYSLAWTADGKHVASGSLDTHAYVWSLEKPLKSIAIKNAVAGGVFTV